MQHITDQSIQNDRQRLKQIVDRYTIKEDQFRQLPQIPKLNYALNFNFNQKNSGCQIAQTEALRNPQQLQQQPTASKQAQPSIPQK